jgi:hypothetical protein
MLNSLLIAADGLPVGGKSFLSITAASRGLLYPGVPTTGGTGRPHQFRDFLAEEDEELMELLPIFLKVINN